MYRYVSERDLSLSGLNIKIYYKIEEQSVYNINESHRVMCALGCDLASEPRKRVRANRWTSHVSSRA